VATTIDTAKAFTLLEEALAFWFANHPDNEEAVEMSKAWKALRLEVLLSNSFETQRGGRRFRWVND